MPNLAAAPTLVPDVLSPSPAFKQAAVDNPFLEGAFAPVAQESTATTLSVTGQLPPELNGLYVRIGPNPLKAPSKAKKYHWFTGDGMVHGIKLSQGQATWYRNRWLGSKSVNRELGRPVMEGKTRGMFDTVNTNVFAHAGRLWASVEAGPVPIQLDGELNSVRHALFDNPSTLPYTAHPHLDPVSGDLHAICYDSVTHNKVYYMRVDARGQLDKVVDIPVKHGPMIHDCAITQTQVVVLDLPVTFSWKEIIKRSGFPYIWNPDHAARVGLLPRDGQAKDTRWFDVEPCYVFHTCNAFDQPDGSVVMDVVVHRHMFDQSRIGPEGDTAPQFERWTLPAKGSRVVREVICTRQQEFPRLDERLVGRPYRYAYAMEFSVDQRGGLALLKHDLQARITTEHQFGPSKKPGEFVFVPKHATSAEDEGWLVGFVYNLSTQQGEFHVVDAQNLAAPAQAVVTLPARVPMGFHGNWVADSALTSTR